MTSRYDIVIFGATGHTGKITIPVVDKLSKDNGRNYTWAVAGRSQAKLFACLAEVGEKNGKDYSNIPVVVADVKDPESMNRMAKQARIIINTIGPYNVVGEPVVKACVENGCHQVDVSGEEYFIEGMQLKYHRQALETGAYVISACGIVSVPSDIGLMYLQSVFDGTLNSAEVYFSGEEIGGPYPGPILSYGAWETSVEQVPLAGELKRIRRELFPKAIPKLSPILKKRVTHSFRNKHALPYPAADQSVMERTQRYLCEEENIRPVQIAVYFCLKSWFTVFKLGIIAVLLYMFAICKCGRNILLRHPKFFSMGYFSHEPVSEEKLENTTFAVTILGEGWSSKQEDSNAKFATKPDKRMTVEVTGRSPQYAISCSALCVAAVTVLDHEAKLPNKGGVYSPGAAFRNTPIVQELQANGIKFEILK